MKNMKVEKIYIKITLPGEDYGYMCRPQEAKELIDQMVQHKIEYDDDEEYEFSTVCMTEEEFENLPEFTGF